MNTVVIEHVTLNEHAALPGELADNPLFGMWQDREDVADVAAYARRLRAPRYDLNGSRRAD